MEDNTWHFATNPTIEVEIHKAQRIANVIKDADNDADVRLATFVSADGVEIKVVLCVNNPTFVGYIPTWYVVNCFGRPTVQKYERDNVCKLDKLIPLARIQRYYNRKDV